MASPIGNINIPVWLYRVLAVFPLTGMAGVDHFAIGSNQTGMAKALINLVTFGSWYVFDAIQSLNGPKVVQEGLEIPFYGHAEIGKGKITEGIGFGSGKNFLNLLFTLVAVVFYFAGDALVNSPGALGEGAKVVKGLAIPAIAGIGGVTLMNFFKKPTPSASGGVPGIPGGVPGIPGGVPGVPSIDQLTKMVGGGAPQSAEPTSDTFILGILFVLSACGFILSSYRTT